MFCASKRLCACVSVRVFCQECTGAENAPWINMNRTGNHSLNKSLYSNNVKETMMKLERKYTVRITVGGLSSVDFFLLLISNTMAYFNDPLWKTADSVHLINPQMKETPQPFG